MIPQRVILSQVQEVLTALRQNTRFSENSPHQRQSPLLLNLCQLRSSIRESNESSFSDLTCVMIATPFLEVVRSEETSGAVTGSALGALSALLRGGLFSGDRSHADVAMSDLVEGVSSCRFEFTDARHDEVVKMQMMEVLHQAATCANNHLLTDESMWNIVTEYFVHRNTVVHSLTLCHAAEQCLLSIVTVIFTRFRILIEGETSGCQTTSSPPITQHRRGFGLPVAVKVVAFLCAQLHTQSPMIPSSDRGGSSSVAEDKVAAEKDSARRLCLTLLHTALETAGGKAIAKCPPIQALVRDDVCHALLCIGQFRGTGASPEVLTEAMMLVRTLWDAPFRKFLKIQLEAIFIGVFLQHLRSAASVAEAHGDAATHIIESAFDARVAGGSGGGMSSGSSKHANSGGHGGDHDSSQGGGGGSSSSFINRGLESEIILEGLGDLTASNSFFVDLFINFDCDLARTDVLETLISLLSTCARSPAPSLKAVRSLAMGTLLNGLKAMTNRCDHHGDHLAERLTMIEHNKHPLWLKKLRKRTLKVGALKFNEKPRTGLQSLMADGLLPTPLTPESVVKFLRTAPGLDKQVVGSFLGEAGKTVKETTPTTFVADTAIFHEQVLKCFATSFDFSGQPIVVALRMFLSAFRLPGEAQQIDRVVQSFADMAFLNCIEPRAGVLATTDTVYLLAFSIIMLHTDLHNPNIRPEKRMTCADFIKNNTNYGQDISKGRDLPPELLESIFKQISEEEFETHKSADADSFSNAKWRDLLRSVEADPTSGMMLSPFDWNSEHESTSSHESTDNSDAQGGGGDDQDGQTQGDTESLAKAQMLRTPSALPLSNFVSTSQSKDAIAALEFGDEGDDAVKATSPLPPGGGGGVVIDDADEVVYAVDSMLLHLVWRPVMQATAGLFLLGKAQGSAANPDSLRQAVDASLVLAKLLARHKMQAVFDTLVFMLCGFTGLLSPWPNTPEVNDRGSPLVSPSLKAEVALLRDLVACPSARMAAVAVFGVAHRLGSSLRHGWQPILRLIFRMRDLHILDPGMLVESDGDLLDPINRRAFNTEVLSQRNRLLKEQRMSQRESKQGGLLGWIFGGGGGGGGQGGKSTSKNKRGKQVELWNHGAHTDSSASQQSHVKSEQSLLNMPSNNGTSRIRVKSVSESTESMDTTDNYLLEESEEFEDSDEDSSNPREDGEMEMLIKERSNLRIIAAQQVAACQVGEIILDSREVSEGGLWALIHSLTAAIHAHLPPDETACLKKEDGGSVDRIDERVGLMPIDVVTINAPREVYLPPLSAPCLPFAEVMLVEITLRNRDRIAAMWPLLKEHYRRRLQGARVVSFGVEKAATGLLRLSARVASRPNMASPMLSEALSWLLPSHSHPDVVKALNVHLGSGLLRIVRHTDALVELPPHHWHAMFGVLESCAQSSGEGSVRAFEALCLVLHESRLRTCVPATCVQPVSAFLASPTSSEPMAIAALDLLTVLHARLAIIATTSASADSSSTAPNVGELWGSCWTPVAEAIVGGCKDKRMNVRLHALAALRDALIKDTHVIAIERNAPEEIHRLIHDLLCPLAEFYFPTEDEENEEEEGEEDDDEDDDSDSDEGSSNETPVKSAVNVSKTETGKEVAEGFEIVPSPVPSEKRNVESRTLCPHLFEKHMNPTVKTQVMVLEIICKTFLLHLKSILPLPWSKCRIEASPPFHEVWNRILSLLSNALSQFCNTVQWAAVEHIKVLLLTVAEMGGFTPGDNTVGRELWEFTWTVLQSSAGSSASTTIASIQLHLFPGSDFTHPPSPSLPTPDKVSALASLPPAHAAAISSVHALAAVLPSDLMSLLIETP